MSSDDIVVDVQSLGKCYEIYATPRDRLKQLMLPRLLNAPTRVLSRFGLAQPAKSRRYYREFWALNNVSFQVRRGETFGIIGRNGSGKSTLLQILAGTLTPTKGNAVTKGRIAALLELGSGFNPEFTGRENVFLNGRILGLGRKEIAARYDEIVEFADIGDFIEQPVKTYSSGMFLRLAFAVQAHVDASIVIIDEALAVGDVFFRQKCFARLDQIRNSGAAILFVSHSMPEIEQYCERALLLNHGTNVFLGPATEATKHYYLLHQTAVSGSPRRASRMSRDIVRGTSGPSIDRPPPEAFFDLSERSQIGNGQARCIGVALCDAKGNPCTVFQQGDTAVFYYEFALSDNIDVPVCGLVISNERGVIVHGKSSWQYDECIAPRAMAGDRVICQQEIRLDLGLGEYVFEVGLASVSRSDWENRANISHRESSSRSIRICHVASAGSFAVGFAMRNQVATLTHHGVANLPGKIKIFARLDQNCVKHACTI